MAWDWQNLHTFQVVYSICCVFSLFYCFSVCSATFTNEIQPIVWHLGKSWVTWAIPRIQCKVSGCSEVCCKPSVPYAALSWWSGCIDHCWLCASSLTLLCCVPSHQSPCSCLRHDAEIPPILSWFWCWGCFQYWVWQGRCWTQCRKVKGDQGGSVLSFCGLGTQRVD